MYEYFFNIKTVKIFLTLAESVNSGEVRVIKLARNCMRNEIVTTYANILRLVKLWENDGLIKTKKEGRDRIIYLTPKGKVIVNLINKILNMGGDVDVSLEKESEGKKGLEKGKSDKKV